LHLAHIYGLGRVTRRPGSPIFAKMSSVAFGLSTAFFRN
jgi:hypothetical protein